MSRTRAIIAASSLLAAGWLANDLMNEDTYTEPQWPRCPTEDSCYPEYDGETGEWRIIAGNRD
jgi:hypothetical protein